MFTEREREYLKSRKLGRIATVGRGGQPDVAAIAIDFDGERFTVHGARMTGTIKFNNVRRGGNRVAIIVDDLPGDARPGEGKARGVKIYGSAEIVEGDGAPVIVVTPDRLWSWGIEASTDHNNASAMRRARSK